MEQKRILVVDDERDLCDILLFNLRSAGYQAEAAYSAEEALGMGIEGFHLLLLDVMMPGMSGFELAQQLKGDAATSHIPIIFLTAKDTEDDTLQGFELGADDYVAKPFSVREVIARVKVVLSRAQSRQPQQESPLTFGSLVITPASMTVTIDDQPIALTRTEYDRVAAGRYRHRPHRLREHSAPEKEVEPLRSLPRLAHGLRLQL